MTKSVFALVFVLLNLTQPALAAKVAAPVGLCAALLDNLPESIVKQVKGLEADLANEIEETKSATRQVTEMNQQIDLLEKGMTWKEKKLWYWLAKILGGDPQKLQTHKSYSEKLAQLEEYLAKDTSEDAAADRKVIAALDKFFKANDHQYASLRKTEDELNHLVCETSECLNRIDSAISQIDSAQWQQDMHNMSQMTNQQQGQHSNGNDFWRDHSIRSALQAGQEAGQMAQRLAATIARFREAHEIELSVSSSNNGLDAIIDMSLYFNADNLFVDIMTTMRLNEIEGELNNLSGKLEAIEAELKRQEIDLKKSLDEVLCTARERCNTIDLD